MTAFCNWFLLLFSIIVVYEQRSRQCVVCSAVWPWAEGVGWTCLHWYQVWRLHRELQQVNRGVWGPLSGSLPTTDTDCYRDLWSHRWCVCVCVFCRKLVIKCSSYRQAQWWSHEIRSLSERCDFHQTHRFEGFAPPRPDTLTKWCVHLHNMSLDVFKNIQRKLIDWLVSVMKWVLIKWLTGLLTGMLTGMAISQTWLMHWNRLRRRSSSLIGGQCATTHTCTVHVTYCK